MDVSFIVPLFNCLPITQAMLESLQRTLPAQLSHEIIFVDDGSTDGTREWLRRFDLPPFRVVLNEQNLGFAGANNRGTAIARGSRLVLLNNDLLLTPGWLEAMLEVHAARSSPGATGNVQLAIRNGQVDHAGIYINSKGKPQHDRGQPAARKPWKEVLAVTGACLLIDADLWRTLGGFDEGFSNGGEDIDLCLKARRAGRTNAVALRSVIHHHVSASPGRKRRDEANAHRLAVRWKRELAQAGATAWCRDYCEQRLDAAHGFHAPLASAAAAAHALGWSSTPPACAVDAMDAAIDCELARWSTLLGTPGPSAGAASSPLAALPPAPI